MAGKKSGATIIIKKEEVVEGGHHGGAWKVAYADFVTAMMAFFLLMWLLNATTEDQRKGLADYFAPVGATTHQTSGSGLPFGGRTPFDTGSLVSDRGAMTIKAGKATAMVAPDDADAETSAQLAAPRMIEDEGEPASAQLSRTQRPNAVGAVNDRGEASGAKEGDTDPGAGPGRRDAVQERDERERRAELARESARQQRAEQQAFEAAAGQIRDAVRADPTLAGLVKQLAIDLTPEGLRIQLLDEDKQAMFATGSSVPNERARLLLQKIAPVLAKLPEPVSITGHTDAQAYRGGDRSNWELSSERANATRRLLLESGLQDDRVRTVSGTADRDLLLPADPFAAANRRIAITVLRAGPGSRPAAVARASGSAPPPGPEPAEPAQQDAAPPRPTSITGSPIPQRTDSSSEGNSPRMATERPASERAPAERTPAERAPGGPERPTPARPPSASAATPAPVGARSVPASPAPAQSARIAPAPAVVPPPRRPNP